MLAHIEDIVSATTLPVNADFLNGFADEPEQVADNIRRCLATGVAGLSIEDSAGRSDLPLYDKSLAVERIACSPPRNRHISDVRLPSPRDAKPTWWVIPIHSRPPSIA